MRRIISNIIMAMTIIVTAAWSFPIHAARTAPEGYKTYELPWFSVSVPDEFNKSEGWSSETTMRLDSDKINTRDDGEEYSSSATIDIYQMEGDIADLNEFANNMVWSIKAMDEECEEPVIEGNTALLRSTSELEEGFMINWRFLVVNEDGRIAGGTISYFNEDAKFYDGIVTPIIQSIQFK